VGAGGGPGLTVRIVSFSYKRGYTRTDAGGHGGGFVFDCRGLPNPGRQLEFSDQSGLDDPVIRFLESREEPSLLARRPADGGAQVEEYLRRGFTSLAVSFGCTGGPAPVGVHGGAAGAPPGRGVPQVTSGSSTGSGSTGRAAPDPGVEPDEPRGGREGVMPWTP
jgi:hypothetical protein